MGKLPRKRTRELAKQAAFGKTLGELEAQDHYHTLKRSWKYSFRAHIGKWIDRTDFIKMVAFISGLIVIKTYIVGNADIQEKLKKIETTSPLGFIETETIGPILAIAGVTEQATIGTPNAMEAWALAIFMTYIVIEHGGQILGLLGNELSGLTSLAEFLLA